MFVKNLYDTEGEEAHEKTVRSWRVIRGTEVGNKNLVFIDDDIVEPNMRIKEHKDEWDEFYYILQGEGEIKVGRELKKVREGDLIFIPRETVHSLKNTKKRPLRFICVAVRI
jgi:mannose-6-phosphate isomerase-like protein (cupin superfamily)